MAGAYRGAAGNHLPGATYHTLLGALAVFVPVFHGFQGPTRQVGSFLSCLCARLRNSQAHRRADTRSLSGPCFSRIVRQPSSYAGTVLLARGLLRKYVRPAEQNSHLSGWLFCLMASHWPPKLSYVCSGCRCSGLYSASQVASARSVPVLLFPCIGTAMKQSLSAPSSRAPREQVACQTWKPCRYNTLPLAFDTPNGRFGILAGAVYKVWYPKRRPCAPSSLKLR